MRDYLTAVLSVQSALSIHSDWSRRSETLLAQHNRGALIKPPCPPRRLSSSCKSIVLRIQVLQQLFLHTSSVALMAFLIAEAFAPHCSLHNASLQTEVTDPSEGHQKPLSPLPAKQYHSAMRKLPDLNKPLPPLPIQQDRVSGRIPPDLNKPLPPLPTKQASSSDGSAPDDPFKDANETDHNTPNHIDNELREQFNFPSDLNDIPHARLLSIIK